MRLVTLLFIFTSLLLAACGGGQPQPENNNNNVDATAPAEVVAEGTESVEPTDDPNIVVVTLPSGTDDFALEVAAPGTLVVSETEDPNVSAVFDQIIFTRSRGPEGAQRIQLELFQDGRFVLNGVQGQVPIETVLSIDLKIDEVNFFGLQGNMLGPPDEGDEYQYALTVIRGIDELSVVSMDGMMPTEYQQLLVMFLDIALNNLPDPTPEPAN